MPDQPRDYLIIGQGLAGSLLAWFFLQAGKKIVIIDPQEEKTCSRVAAGLIHPVTGRRIVKTWNADLFIPFARKTYTLIEDKLGERFFEDYPVLELYNDAGHRNDWTGRSADQGMDRYIQDECSATEVPDGLQAPLGGRWVVNGGWLDTGRFLDALRKYLDGEGVLIQDRLLYDDLEFGNNCVRWKNQVADKIIDCSGADAIFQEKFRSLPFNPCKGEVIRFRAEGLPRDLVVHGAVKIIPIGGNDYIAGATYDFNHINSHCTPEGLEKIELALQKMISVPYFILAHDAAIRPSTSDRRPLLGPIDRDGLFHVFNGLGSKGALLGPWMANYYSDCLIRNQEIFPELQALRMAK
ncbi:MAG: FAD-dependent oxidoreductase [Bacteroidia bacterium]|nr:FAD-dependent oxidoreductase [Bacteroidia bacterium]